MKRIKSMIDDTNLITFGKNEASRDSVERLLNIFYLDQFRHSQDPRAPYFMFLSKNGNLAMGIGGVVKVRGYYDWNGSIPNSGFVPYLIPIPKDPTAMRNLAASASGTGLFFTILGKNTFLGDFMAYIQADFAGYNNRGFRIKKAYFTAGDWTAGYTTTTFEDTKAEPETVDGSGPNGINSRKNVLVRYLHTFKENLAIAGSVEFPNASISADGVNTAACKSYIPDLAAFVQWQWKNGSHIRLSGLFRTITYRDLLLAKNYNVPGWAVQLSGIWNITHSLSMFGIVSTGRGHSSYTTDLSNGDFDLIQDTDHPGKLYAPMAAGFVYGCQYFWSDKLRSNLALSEQTYYPKKNPENTQYKYGLYLAANLFWDVTPRFEVGVEYLYGKRKNFNGNFGSADRVMAMMMLSF